MAKNKKGIKSKSQPKKLKKKLVFKFSLPKKQKNKSNDFHKKFKNPKITSITLNSHFIYDINIFETYFNDILDRNRLKLNQEELIFLKNKIEELNILNNDNNMKNNSITIPLQIYNKINSFFAIPKTENKCILYIKNLIESQKDKGHLSCRKIATKYFLDTGYKISKTKVNDILKNKLCLKYLKTTIKTNKVNNNRNIIISLCFIKIIIKCLKLNYKIIFIDESSIQCNTNNFRTWRKKDESIYFNLGNTKKKNLIAAIDDSNLLYYTINDENTNEQIFLDFMVNLKNILKSLNINNNFVIILDNLSCHKTALLNNYYLKEKINVLFNSPYQSQFNCIELFFRLIKQKLYQKIFSSTDDAIEEIKDIINDNNLKYSLKRNFRETLEAYYKYALEHNNINLNNFNYEE